MREKSVRDVIMRRYDQELLEVPLNEQHNNNKSYWKSVRDESFVFRGQGRYRGGETSVESAIPCSHKGKTLVVKRAEEVENAKAFSKYQDKVEGQRSENFIRLVSTGFSSR
ncbi:hypothetical protein GW17_00040703 [Ensete ventricosum]|nr:hypothetical protein GW17_00040703 [Ensete ventricosum]